MIRHTLKSTTLSFFFSPTSLPSHSLTLLNCFSSDKFMNRIQRAKTLQDYISIYYNEDQEKLSLKETALFIDRLNQKGLIKKINLRNTFFNSLKMQNFDDLEISDVLQLTPIFQNKGVLPSFRNLKFKFLQRFKNELSKDEFLGFKQTLLLYKYFSKIKQTQYHQKLIKNLRKNIFESDNLNQRIDRATSFLQQYAFFQGHNNSQKQLYHEVSQMLESNFEDISIKQLIDIYKPYQLLRRLKGWNFFKKMEEKILSHIEEMDSFSLVKLIDSSFFKGTNPVVKKIFANIISVIDNEEILEMNSFSIVKLLQRFSYLQKMSTTPEDRKKVLNFIIHLISLEDIKYKKYHSAIVTIITNNFFKSQELQIIQQKALAEDRLQNIPKYLFCLSKYNISFKLPPFQIFQLKSENQIILSIIIGILNKRYSKDQNVSQQYMEIQQKIKAFLEQKPHLFFNILSQFPDLVQQFTKIYEEPLVNFFQNFPQPDANENDTSKKLSFNMRTFIILSNNMRIRQTIFKKQLLFSPEVLLIFIQEIQNGNRDWIKCSPNIFKFLVKYGNQINERQFFNLSKFLTSNNFVRSISNFVGLYFSVLKNLLTIAKEKNAFFFLPKEILTNYILKLHPLYVKFLRLLLEVDGMMSNRILINECIHYNTVFGSFAKKILNSDVELFQQQRLYLQIIGQENKKIASQKINNLELNSQNLFTIFRFSYLNHEYIEKNFLKIKEIIPHLSRQNVERCLYNFEDNNNQHKNQFISLLELLLQREKEMIDSNGLPRQRDYFLTMLIKFNKKYNEVNFSSLIVSIIKKVESMNLSLVTHQKIIQLCFLNSVTNQIYMKNLHNFLKKKFHVRQNEIKRSSLTKLLAQLLEFRPIDFPYSIIDSPLSKEVSRDEIYESAFAIFFHNETKIKKIEDNLQKLVGSCNNDEYQVKNVLVKYFGKKYPSIFLNSYTDLKKPYIPQIVQGYRSILDKFSSQTSVKIQTMNEFGVTLFKINDKYFSMLHNVITAYSRSSWKRLFSCLFEVELDEHNFILLSTKTSSKKQFEDLCENIPEFKEKQKKLQRIWGNDYEKENFVDRKDDKDGEIEEEFQEENEKVQEKYA